MGVMGMHPLHKVSTWMPSQWKVHTCNDQFPHSQNQLPSGRLGLSLCAGPPVTRSTSDRGNVYGGIIVDIEAKGSKFP